MSVATATPVMLAFDVEVAAVQRVGPNVVRVAFGGDCLADFDGGGPHGPRDLRVKIMFPSAGRELPDLSDLSRGWYQRWLALDPSVRGAMRTYTVRRARTAGQEPQIEVDFVVHVDAQGVSGPGSAWAAQAAPGQRLTIIGPYAGGHGYGGIEWQPPAPGPRGAAPVRVLLAGDETAVPAICSILESLGEGYSGHALLEVQTAADIQAVPGGAVEVRWLPRDGRPHGTALRGAVAEVMGKGGAGRDGAATDVGVDAEVLWEVPGAAAAVPVRGAPGQGEGRFYAWVAGEASAVRDIRRLLVHDCGIDRSQVAFMGYWRRGRAEG